MKKLTIPLAIVAVATLAACGAHRDVRPGPTAYVVPMVEGTPGPAARPGAGKVVYITDPTGPVNGISTQYLTLKMEDGTTQNIKRRGQQIAMGAHLVIRSDNTVQTASN